MGNPSVKPPNRLRSLLLQTFFLLSIVGIHGQENTKTDIGSWMVFSMDNQLSEKWSVPVVAILCYENWAEQTEFGFVRTGLTYKTSPTLKLTLGTAYVDSQPLYHHEFETLTTQVWVYEQATIKTGTLQHRLRMEHRWIDKPTKNIFNTRLRYRLGFKQRLGTTYYIKCTDEPFFNFDELYIDQNRFFVGIGRKLGKDVSMEFGYFKTHVGKKNFDRLRVAIHLKTLFFKRNPEDLTQSDFADSSK